MDAGLITGYPNEKPSYVIGVAFYWSLIDYFKWQEVPLHIKILVFCNSE